MLKWKREEFSKEPKLKWRDVVSFAHNIFRQWARLVGQYLPVLIVRYSAECQGLGRSNLRGVRDITRSAIRIVGGGYVLGDPP